MTRRLIPAVALIASLAHPLAAQRGAPAPTNVLVTGTGSSATVTWTPVPAREVTYRVLRSEDPRGAGMDLARPTEETSLVDQKLRPGVTYFYQVIAVYADGTSSAAAPIGFTLPSATTGVNPAVLGQPIGRVPGGPGRSPTTVTGVTVTGTLASATLSWQPVEGAVSYTVTRTLPVVGQPPSVYPGLTTTAWTDQGSSGKGLEIPGVYLYQVSAMLGNGSTVSGQASFTRPSPTCAAPLPSQTVLTVLDPTNGFDPASLARLPIVVLFQFFKPKNNGVVAYRVERGVQGSNAWTLVATTCGTPALISGMSHGGAVLSFSDGLGGIVPGTTYLYRLTALAATGEVGIGTVVWVAPAASTVRWLSATAAGGSVTLQWRYEPPAVNAPTMPNRFRFTAPYGLNQVASNPGCTSVAGCSLVVSGVPPGTHQFTVTGEWGNVGSLGGVLSTATTVLVP